MDAAISRAIPSALMAGIIWRLRAPSPGSRSFRRKTGSVHGRPFKLPHARKKKAGQPESPPPQNRKIRYVAAAWNLFRMRPKGWEKRNGSGIHNKEL